MLAVHVALRYLRRRRMAWLAMMAVLLTVSVSVVVLGVMEGWVAFTRLQVKANESDLTLRGSVAIPQRLGLAEHLAAQPGVAAVAPYIATPAPAMPVGYEARAMVPVQVEGVDWRADRAIGRLQDAWLHPRPGLDLSAPALAPEERGTGFVTRGTRAWLPLAGLEALGGVVPLPGSLPPRAYPPVEVGLIAGRELLYEHPFSMRLGNRLTLALPDHRGGTIGRIRCEVSDTIGTGVLEIDRYAAYLPLSAAQRLTDQDDPRDRRGGPSVDGYRMRVDGEARAVRDRLAEDEALRGVIGSRRSLLLWNEIRGNSVRLLELNMRMLRFVMIVIQCLCVFTVAAVFSTLVAEKRHDIGVLLGIGLRPLGVVAIFELAAMVCCVLGGLIGWAIGWGVLAMINPLSEWLGVALFPQSVFYTVEAPIEYNWWTPVSFILLQAGIGLVSALIPAIRAGMIDPVDTIREAG